MRALIAIFILGASTAGAVPGCSDPADTLPLDPAQVHPIDGPESADATVASVPDLPPGTSPRPRLRPCRFQQLEQGREQMRLRGAVCGDWTILGRTREPIVGKARGCGIADPVQVHRISDVFFSQLALMDCETAVTLKTWLENTAKPVFADQGGGLKGMRLNGHYSCKTQNNRPGARLSEHARGRAIDISAFVLNDGTIITVRDGWQAAAHGQLLRDLHSGACGLFGTVLGPDADRFHKGHFHFDTARRSNGGVCR